MTVTTDYIVSVIRASSRIDDISITSADRKNNFAHHTGERELLVKSFLEFHENTTDGTYCVELGNSEIASRAGVRKAEDKPIVLFVRKETMKDARGDYAPIASAPAGFPALSDPMFRLIWELKEELANVKMEKKIAELEAKSSDNSDQILMMLQGLMAGQTKSPIPGIAAASPGISARPAGVAADERKAAFEILRKVDPDFHTTLRALAALALEAPENYKSYRELLVKNLKE